MVMAVKLDISNYAIWDIDLKKFIGVNLSENEAVSLIAEHKGCSKQDAHWYVSHSHPFSDIAKGEDAFSEDEAVHFYKMEIQRCKAILLEMNGELSLDGKIAKRIAESQIKICKMYREALAGAGD